MSATTLGVKAALFATIASRFAQVRPAFAEHATRELQPDVTIRRATGTTVSGTGAKTFDETYEVQLSARTVDELETAANEVSAALDAEITQPTDGAVINLVELAHDGGDTYDEDMRAHVRTLYFRVVSVL